MEKDIIITGPQAAGKTRFAEKYFKRAPYARRKYEIWDGVSIENIWIESSVPRDSGVVYVFITNMKVEALKNFTVIEMFEDKIKAVYEI